MSGLHFTSVNQKVYTAPLKFAKRNMFPVVLFTLTFIIWSAQANVQFDIINKHSTHTMNLETFTTSR